jgi:hypothetical protein
MWQSGPPLGFEYPGEPGRNGETPARHHSSHYLPRVGPRKDSWLEELRAEGEEAFPDDLRPVECLL